MERQAGLGRSLEDVLDSLAPVNADPTAPGRVLFEPEAVEQQLDQLMADVAALRERVQHLVGLVPDDAVLRVVPAEAPDGADATHDETREPQGGGKLGKQHTKSKSKSKSKNKKRKKKDEQRKQKQATVE